jgi:putative ATPase
MSILILEDRLPTGQHIQVRQGDITQEATDIIVNAANEYLEHGGGVAGTIVQRGGDRIQEESDAWIATHGTVPTGHVAVTGAGRLAATYIIHAVGPIWDNGQHNEPQLLASAVQHSLRKADELSAKSIAIPAISSGIFGFPKDQCAHIIITTIYAYFAAHPKSGIQEVRLTNIDLPTVEVMRKALHKQTQSQKK